MPTRPPGHAFLYKYRPRAPGGLRLQQPREEGNKIFVGADSASPGGRARRRFHAGPRRAARTRGARGGRRAGGRGRGAATRRGPAAGAEARGRGRLTSGPTDTQVRRRGRRARAGRKRAKVTSPRVLREGFAFSFSFFFFSDFKAFSGFFLSFSLFFLQAAEPESGRSCGDPGRREAAGGATAPFIPARPGRCWSKGARRPGRSRARPLGPGARGGAATRERPVRPRCATATPGARRTSPRGACARP